MSCVRIIAQAPSNIALVKYMGKKDSSQNLPDNPSLSMTLSSLRSIVELSLTHGSSEVRWVNELPRLSGGCPGESPQLSESGIKKVIQHVERVRRYVPELFAGWGIPLHLERMSSSCLLLRTANTFPQASGIASSASSFAALTLATAAAFTSSRQKFERVWKEELRFKRALAQISREGSGSSCRSFEGPWVEWSEDHAQKVDCSSLNDLSHFVVLIKTDPKKVSSSEAHLRIKTSPLWEGRVRRTQDRVIQLRAALQVGSLESVAQIAWDEAWEMHSLFHTSQKPFTYWEPGSILGLKYFSETQDAWPSSPIVTLDAGPNLHVLVLKRDQGYWRKKLQEIFPSQVILEDAPGTGASLESWEET